MADLAAPLEPRPELYIPITSEKELNMTDTEVDRPDIEVEVSKFEVNSSTKTDPPKTAIDNNTQTTTSFKTSKDNPNSDDNPTATTVQTLTGPPLIKISETPNKVLTAEKKRKITPLGP